MKATAGFNTKKAAIAHLHSLGLPSAAIAHELRCNTNSVSVILCHAGLKPHPTNNGRRPSQTSFVELSADIIPLLNHHAIRRGMTPAALAALIIDTVTEHGLVDAILDDKEG